MAMTAAEKMKRYRERKKAAGLKQCTTWVPAGEQPADLNKAAPKESTNTRRALKAAQVPAAEAPDLSVLREQIIKEYEASTRAKWNAEIKEEKIKAARKGKRKGQVLPPGKSSRAM